MGLDDPLYLSFCMRLTRFNSPFDSSPMLFAHTQACRTPDFKGNEKPPGVLVLYRTYFHLSNSDAN